MDSFLIKNKEIIYRAHQILNSGVHGGGSVYADKRHVSYILYVLIFGGIMVCAFIFARDSILSTGLANIYRSLASDKMISAPHMMISTPHTMISTPHTMIPAPETNPAPETIPAPRIIKKVSFEDTPIDTTNQDDDIFEY
jgi:hypothetical protein